MNNNRCVSLKGTLIVVIPTCEGVVVAADGVSYVADEVIPSSSKLHTIDSSAQVVFTITGTANFHKQPPADIGIREWIQSQDPIFSGERVISDFLSNTTVLAIDSTFLQSLSDELLHNFNAYFNTSDELRDRFSNQEICRPVIVRYSPDDTLTTIATFLLGSNERGELYVSQHQIENMEISDERFVGLYGENQYVTENVLKPGSIGWPYLGEDIGKLWNGPSLIRDMTPNNAANISKRVINATEKASGSIPINTAVGGAPLVLLINGKDPILELKIK